MRPVAHHTLLVPNSIIGRIFLWWFKKYLNRETYRIRARGRGPRVLDGRRYFQDLPVDKAPRLAIYLDVKDTARERERLMREASVKRTNEEFARRFAIAEHLPPLSDALAREVGRRLSNLAVDA